MSDATDDDLAARAILCPSWCTAEPSHLDVGPLDSGVLHTHMVFETDLPPWEGRSAGSSVRVQLTQYVGRDDDVQEPEVFLGSESRDFGDVVSLSAAEAVQVAKALIDAARLLRPESGR